METGLLLQIARNLEADDVVVAGVVTQMRYAPSELLDLERILEDSQGDEFRAATAAAAGLRFDDPTVPAYAVLVAVAAVNYQRGCRTDRDIAELGDPYTFVLPGDVLVQIIEPAGDEATPVNATKSATAAD